MDQLPDFGTIVRVLPDGAEYLISGRRVACADAGRYLAQEMGLEFSQHVSILVMSGDPVSVDTHAAVARTVKDAGYTSVGLVKLGIFRERAPQSGDS